MFYKSTETNNLSLRITKQKKI